MANTGSAGLHYDGDPRASYLLIDNGTPSIRRVYDIAAECAALVASGIPHVRWTVHQLLTASFHMPPPSL